jgi:hypothetical protein
MAAERTWQRALPITAVLLVVVVAMVLILTAHWRKGAAALGVAAVLAAVLRVAVPERLQGALAVRSRAFDVCFLLAAAAVMFLLSVGFYWF